MRAEEVVDALEKLRQELLTEARVQEGVAARWPSCSPQQRARQERAGAYRDSAMRVWRLKETAALARVLEEQETASLLRKAQRNERRMTSLADPAPFCTCRSDNGECVVHGSDAEHYECRTGPTRVSEVSE